jgi:hypothetical protein
MFKYLLLVTAAAAFMFLCVGLYEFFEDTRLGGMPRKMIEVDLATRDRRPLIARYRDFALSHGFNVRDMSAAGVWPALSLRLTRWDAEIAISSATGWSGRNPIEDPTHLSIWVAFKGWLWWTDLHDADSWASELARETKAVDPAAKIRIETLPPLDAPQAVQH